MAEPEIIEDFYGVYLLYNINPKYRGRTYIGYTRDPNRRIMQHNRGTWAGGAHRTSKRGPWKMVLIVHGFPNNISALRFEWAWQNPNKTTRLQHLDLKKIPRKESEFQFKLRVLSEMLRVGPWCRLPLMIRWLENEYREEFPPERKPPDHMAVIQGPVKSHNHKKAKGCTSISTIECLLCSGYLRDAEKLTCTNASCDLVSHITCLANLFLSPGEYIPIDGHCPFCNTKLKWGDLIRRMNGYDQSINNDKPSEEKENDDVYTQDTGDDDLNEMDGVFHSQGSFENDDEVVSASNFDDLVHVTQDRVFVDSIQDDEDDDVICTQDEVCDNIHVIPDLDKDASHHQDLDSDDDVVCIQDDAYNFNSGDNNVIHKTRNDYKTDDINYNNSDDSDDEVLFKRIQVNDDQPSWFLDCNENL